MSTSGIDRRRALALAGAAWIGSRSVAGAQSRPPSVATRPDDTAAETPRLPPAVTTHHTLELPGRILHFEATAGAILLTDEKHAPSTELAFVAFQSEGARSPAPGDVRVQRRAGLLFGLAECRRGRTMAHCDRWRCHRAIGVARTDAECRDLARLHRSGVHRPGRHRVFARAREQSRCASQAVVGRGRHRLSRRGDPPLAGPVRPQCLAEIPAGRKLWRLPRGAAAGTRTHSQPGNRRLRPCDDIAGARPRRPQFRVRTVRLCDTPALDDSCRASRAGDGDARRPRGCRALRHDRLPARPDARRERCGGDRPAQRSRRRIHRSRSRAGATLSRTDREQGVPARTGSCAWPRRQQLRRHDHQGQSIPARDPQRLSGPGAGWAERSGEQCDGGGL